VSAARLSLTHVDEDAPPVPLPETGTLVIGASPERAGLVLRGRGIDDAHCAIGAVKGGGYAVKDLGSRNGTLLNGKRITSARLAPGDTLALGERSLRVVAPDERPTEPAAQKGAPAIPKRVGGYRIERLLGRGGMGTVLLATQESLNRPVALKLLSPRLAADAEFVMRFQKEARAAAALSHPNVVVVHDVGEADGLHFLSMEYMDKGSLEERLGRSGSLPWREVLDILVGAARGLAYAEERGILHRDIKPANLMQSAAGTVKIADLGLATSIEAEASESDGKRILGTPHFISPEQARGEPIDHRSDLYSLGATAYRLLTGRTPFEGATTRDILRGHLSEEPAPLSHRVAAIPPELEALVLCLLAKDPADRPRSAAELVAALERLRVARDHGVAVGARPKAASRGGLLALGLLVFAAAGVFFVWQQKRETEAPPSEPPARAADLVPDGADEELFATGQAPGADAAAALEAELRERNLLAENAYLRIAPELSKSQRAERLAALAVEFEGTDTAVRARAEAAQLLREAASESALASGAAARLGAFEAELRLAMSAPAGELPQPARALAELAARTPPADVTPEEAQALAARLAAEVVATAEAAFARRLEQIEEELDQGAFDGAEQALRDLAERLVLPDFAPGNEPAGLAGLALQKSLVDARLEGLPAERMAFAESRRLADRGLLAGAFRAEGGLAAALRAFEPQKAAAELDALAADLHAGPPRAFAEGLSQDLKAAEALRRALIADFAAGRWRRRSVLDPRERRLAPRDVVACDDQGLYVDDRGERELVPWSAFAASSEALAQLFKERLERPYSAAELRGAAGALRVAAAFEAAELVLPVLAPGSPSKFSPAEEERLLAAYAHAEPWSDAGAPLAREAAAARILVQALRDYEARSWSAAAASLERLIVDYGDTLLVVLCSDGSAIAESAAGAPAGDAAPEAGAGDGR
jgi:hypothetical protein